MTSPAVATNVSVTVDGTTVEVPQNTLVLDAATAAGVHVPIYCAHSKMDPVAVCRMCLVDIDKMPKLMPACATNVTEGMVVHTDSERVTKAREGVLEFLLLNHPLDCPVCDRGGECDLQDFAFRYGPEASRMPIVEKRHFEKAIPLSEKIELDQERCILCWRCVRYYDEITGEKELVLQQRGVHTTIGTFNDAQLTSDFQGNLPEVCPVGALTHRQYRFRARPWDLQRTSSVCPECSYGCNINVDSRDYKVMRFASRDNPAVDDMWLCDKGRYSATSWNDMARIRKSAVRSRGALRDASYTDALTAAATGLASVLKKKGASAIGVIASPRLTNEELWLTQRMAREVIGTTRLSYGASHGGGSFDDSGLGIAAIEDCGEVIVIGERPESYSPVLTLRLHKAARKNHVVVHRVATTQSAADIVGRVGTGDALVGVVADETDHELAVSVVSALELQGRTSRRLSIVEGVNGRGARDLGLGGLQRAGYDVVVKGEDALDALRAGHLAGLLVVDGAGLKESFDDKAIAQMGKLECVVAIESVPSSVSDNSTVLIPGHAYLEKGGTVTNVEGRVQRIRPALPPVTGDPSEVTILQDLAVQLGASWNKMDGDAIRRQIADSVRAYGAAGVGGRTTSGGA